jgi:hypothetical protein
MQNELLVIKFDRMTRIIPTLVATYQVGLSGHKVHDFPFAFVAPLATDDN